MYVDSIRSDLMPENCYTILFRKFQGVFEDEIFQNALNHIDCDRGFSLVSHGHLINPNYHAEIPLDDYISSRETFKLVNAISDRAYASGVAWPGGHVATNLLTYHLMTILILKSTCDTLDCLVFRTLIEQFHFRLTIILKSTRENENKFDFLRPLDVLFSARHRMEEHVETLLHRSDPDPPVGRAVPLSFSIFDCCGWFRRRPRHPTSQILTPRNDSREMLRTRQIENAADALAYNAKRQLDSVLMLLESRTSYSITRSSISKNLIKPLMRVARGVLYSRVGAGTERVIQKIFRLISFVETATEDGNSWPRILDMTLEIVSQLRLFIL
jgi:hypothetical protein